MFAYRGRWTIVFIGFGITAFFFLPDLAAVVVGPIFFLAALALWVIPLYRPNQETEGPTGDDRLIKVIANTMLGLGLGFLAAIAFFFAPPDWFGIMIGAGVAVIVGYLIWFWRMR